MDQRRVAFLNTPSVVSKQEGGTYVAQAVGICSFLDHSSQHGSASALCGNIEIRLESVLKARLSQC